MIDDEIFVFNKLKEKIREVYGDTIYLTNKQANGVAPKFPAVSIRQIGNTVNNIASTFNSIELASNTTYTVEVCSNTDKKEKQVKEIISVINDEFTLIGYTRIFCEPVNSYDTDLYRMICRFQNTIIIK